MAGNKKILSVSPLAAAVEEQGPASQLTAAEGRFLDMEDPPTLQDI